MNNEVKLPRGKYVLAVSGGVDSVVLLDLVSKQKGLDIVVAHYDHGIRKDSSKDKELVQNLATKYGYKFECEEGNLGPDINEADARDKRYDFLNGVKQKCNAIALVTAHHQDDLIETSMINILRGTGRRGLTSLKSNSDIVRPLLSYPKKYLIEYAEQNDLNWNEDSTNKDTKILRNYLRINIVAKMPHDKRAEWIAILDCALKLNNKLDFEIQNLLRRGLHKNQPVLNRGWFIMLPYDISKEVLLAILYKIGLKDIDKKTIERLTVQIKTLPGGKFLQATGVDIILTKRSARFKNR